MRICTNCHGTGKKKVPVFVNCEPNDPDGIKLITHWIKVAETIEKECHYCDGKGMISYQPPENIFIG